MKPLPQAAPEGGGASAAEHFGYAPTPTNSRWHAYIAGPAQWVWCHEPKKTKPCLAILTNRALECPWCGTPKPVVRKAYVPLYRAADWSPRCVIVTELYEDVLSKLKFHDRVTVGKEAEKGDPVWITRAIDQRPAFNTTRVCRMNPVDLTCSLLRIWGNDALRRWCEVDEPVGSPTQSDNSVSLPAPAVPVTNWKQFVEVGSLGKLEGTVTNPGKHRNEEFVSSTRNGTHKAPKTKPED